MARRVLSYAELFARKGTYAVKAERERRMARFARKESALKAALDEIAKARLSDDAEFGVEAGKVNAETVNALPVLPKKSKAEVEATTDTTATDTVAPDGTVEQTDQTVVPCLSLDDETDELILEGEIIELETDIEALTPEQAAQVPQS